jgi:hypothetical protein
MCRTPLAELQLRFSEDHMYRWKNWKLLESAGLSPESRLLQISTTLLNAVSDNCYWTPDFFDAAVDLFDFLRYILPGCFLHGSHKSQLFAGRRAASGRHGPPYGVHFHHARLLGTPECCPPLHFAVGDGG